MPRDMTEQRFMEGFDRTNMLVNCFVAVAIHYNLDVARKYASPDDISELEERFGKKE